MQIELIAVPYDTARRGARMGSGPEHWMARGLPDRLRDWKHDVHVTIVEDDDPEPAEIKTAIALNRRLAARVAEARAAGRLPLVVSGNCNSALGTLSGLGPAQTGVVWFDAHGDFNTPDTTGTGFFDGMGLAIAAGLGWQRLTATIPGFAAVSGAHIIHVGGRAFDAGEREALEHAGAAVVDANAIHQNDMQPLASALDALATRVSQIYLHLDLDVLDPDLGLQANPYPEPGGLSVAQVRAAVEAIRARLGIAAVALTSYDPVYDTQDNVLDAGFAFVRTALGG